MAEEEIETRMDEEETQRRMYEEYRGAIPFYYRGWAIVTLALISMKLPLLWVAVIYLIIMRNLRIIDYFDALEVSIKEAVQESNDLYVEAMTKAKEAEGYFNEALEMVEEAKRNVAAESNRLKANAEIEIGLKKQLWEGQRAAEEKALACDRKFSAQINEMYREAHEKVDLDIEALLKEKAALNLAVKQLRETHEQLQMVYAEEDEIRPL